MDMQDILSSVASYIGWMFLKFPQKDIQKINECMENISAYLQPTNCEESIDININPASPVYAGTRTHNP